MSSRQLEDRLEQERDEWVARSLGLSVDDLNQHVWDVHQIDGNGGAVYGHRVEFDADTDPDFIARLGGDHSINIGFPPEQPEPDQPD